MVPKIYRYLHDFALFDPTEMSDFANFKMQGPFENIFTKYKLRINAMNRDNIVFQRVDYRVFLPLINIVIL